MQCYDGWYYTIRPSYTTIPISPNQIARLFHEKMMLHNIDGPPHIDNEVLGTKKEEMDVYIIEHHLIYPLHHFRSHQTHIYFGLWNLMV